MRVNRQDLSDFKPKTATVMAYLKDFLHISPLCRKSRVMNAKAVHNIIICFAFENKCRLFRKSVYYNYIIFFDYSQQLFLENDSMNDFFYFSFESGRRMVCDHVLSDVEIRFTFRLFKDRLDR